VIGHRGWPSAVARTIADAARTVFVDPVRDGRLRVERWPAGLVPIGVVGVVGYAFAVVTVLAAGPLRAGGPLVFHGGTGLSLPAWAVGALLVLVVLSLAFAQTAVLHAPLWLGCGVTAVSTLLLLSTGGWGGRGHLTAMIPPIVAAAALWTLVFLRRHRRFAWAEFAVVFAALAAGIGAATWRIAGDAAVFGFDAGPMVLTTAMQSIGTLATPAAVAAGAAVAQLSATVATGSVDAVRRHLPAAGGGVLLGALVLWRVWAVTVDVVQGAAPSPGAIAAACGFVALVAVGAALLTGMRRGSPPEPAQLAERFVLLGPALAVVLTITVVPAAFLLLSSAAAYALTGDESLTSLLQESGRALTTGAVTWSVRLLGGLLLVASALRYARAGRRVVPELMLAVGIAVAWSSAVALTGATVLMWTPRALTLVVTAVSILLLCWWLLRRSLTAARGGAVAVALLVAALFDQRTFIEDPFHLVLGFTGLFLVLFGFVWSMLTGGDVANGNSRRYPRTTRVLLYLANALFGVTVLAFGALARDPGAPVDLDGMAGLGDQLLGTGLLAAVLVAALAGGLRARPDVGGGGGAPARIG